MINRIITKISKRIFKKKKKINNDGLNVIAFTRPVSKNLDTQNE